MRQLALRRNVRAIKVRSMIERKQNGSGTWAAVGLLLLLAAPAWMTAQPTPEATAAFNSYIGRVETGLDAQHRSADRLLAPVDFTRLHSGDLIIDQLTSGAGTELPGALLHDWRGTAFIPGGKAADFERLMKNFDAYPKVYAPQVLTARILEHDGDHFQTGLRVQQKHLLTVVMDMTYDIAFGRPDAQRGYSTTRSTKITEIDSPGTAREHALSPGEEHGFLWRMNTYWSYEELDGGLYIQIESVSLSRSIPIGLGWAIGPFIESVPHDSLEFTLRATSNALRR